MYAGRLGIEWLCPHQGASRLWDVGRCAKQGGQEGRQRRETATHWCHERPAFGEEGLAKRQLLGVPGIKS